MKGTLTTCSLTYIAATGARFETDAADNEGFELTQGITDGSPGAFTIGTSPAFYLSVRFGLATVAETDHAYVGFRVAEAYDDNSFAAYTDYYYVGVGDLADGGPGDFFSQTEVNGGGISATDMTQADWTDAQIHTITILVSAAGVATVDIEGTNDATAGAFTFDTGDVVIPSFFVQNDATAGVTEIDVVFWEVGLQ